MLLSSIEWVRENAALLLDIIVLVTIIANVGTVAFKRFGWARAELFTRGLSTSFTDLWQAISSVSKKHGQLEPQDPPK